MVTSEEDACRAHTRLLLCREDAAAEGRPHLAFPSASVYCKTALHLQLTTALVAAAVQPQSRLQDSHDGAQLMSAGDEAVLGTAEGNDASGEGGGPQMWQSVGDAAVREVLAAAEQLHSCVRVIGVEALSGPSQLCKPVPLPL